MSPWAWGVIAYFAFVGAFVIVWSGLPRDDHDLR